MQFTPSQALQHIKEAVTQYLETAYKIAHPSVFEERGELFRRVGTIAQEPFIEATPAFPTGALLDDLEAQYPGKLPNNLHELVRHGVPVDRFPLYTHQVEALVSSFSPKPNLLVATGTGSGKTESFLLPILADIVNEASSWPATTRVAQRGIYDEQNKRWLNSRRHETRPAALRAIVLYPMNALVNDQLSRLRRILARGDSPDWQRANFKGNQIYFGMYTGLTKPTGNPGSKPKRGEFEKYFQKIEDDWNNLTPELRNSGSWPRPDSPEMLCRWDIQAAPPDILVTNYSMLEYMLLRPIEYNIFDITRRWLQQTPDARITLVLDEAHTYTGAKGTEVAYLVRRLKERLGISSSSAKFRAIATTASVPQGADAKLLNFISDLFDEPADNFSLIHTGKMANPVSQRQVTLKTLQAFARFHESFTVQNPKPALELLNRDLEQNLPLDGLDTAVALHKLLEANSDLLWVRQRTARRATLLKELSEECWQGLGDNELREKAISGLLAAGSFARPEANFDVPPLLSMRIHTFVRGIPGLWACMDQDCPVAYQLPSITKRPVGKLYTEPRAWCECGARVLEMFSCRRCGLLYLGGIPDTNWGSLWPWNDSLTGDSQDLNFYRIFGVEQPSEWAVPTYRSTRTTLENNSTDLFARPVYEVLEHEKVKDNNSPFPKQCPRCQNYSATFMSEGGREIIEPLRTKGPRSFSIVAENGFRVQPRASGGKEPNFGRKALLFTDSRQEAAQLAGDLTKDHYDDLFRQIVFRLMYTCQKCDGNGQVEEEKTFIIGNEEVDNNLESYTACEACSGTGKTPNSRRYSYNELRSAAVDFQNKRGIDPTEGRNPDYFAAQESGLVDSWQQSAFEAFNLAARRDISQDEFGMEGLGLASWQAQLGKVEGAFAALTTEETIILLRVVARILARENVILPPEPFKPWEWNSDLVKPYEKKQLYWGESLRNQGTLIPYNLRETRKLGRFIKALSRALLQDGRFQDEKEAEQWVINLRKPLWYALQKLKIIVVAGRKLDNNENPYGIRVDKFELHPIKEQLYQCGSCTHLMSETILNVCLRCGQHALSVSPENLRRNFYREIAFKALPDSGFDDPYPLKVTEHTAQVKGSDARDFERWFQDLFHHSQNRLDKRIDILSVTTTMEMGIDIGSLLSVGLRNVPPNVANYQQRAGRAGRRGSSIATVMTFAQFRSHDQYYFGNPPEIVSAPPRVPMLYLSNEVIARRHVRSLILQDFFYNIGGAARQAGSNLFETWGKIQDYINQGKGIGLERYIKGKETDLTRRARQIAGNSFSSYITTWLLEIPNEIEAVVKKSDPEKELLGVLINNGLLPKYAFPIDVVRLHIPSRAEINLEEDYESADTGMLRDLRIALAEYAPGAEIIKGEFPNTFIYRSASVYDAFENHPDYRAIGRLLECKNCQAVKLIGRDETIPDQCEECNEFDLVAYAYLRPKGFSVDMALPDGGRERYERGGRERAGTVIPARLMVGNNSFKTGKQTTFAPSLYVSTRNGDLFVCNKGVNNEGFLICPDCGRSLDRASLGSHKYPADVPPQQVYNNQTKRGPRAGYFCPNKNKFDNDVILGHSFNSQVILLGVDLPVSMDAPFNEPSGRAIWYSFGTLVANAAALVLQLDASEIKVGVRPVNRGGERIHGEVFLYDDVPGGAGYAQAIEQNLEEILNKALELGKTCSNSDCTGACYYCLYDYRNQMLHAILDRHLGSAVLDYILKGYLPVIDVSKLTNYINAWQEYVKIGWQIETGRTLQGQHFPIILQNIRSKQEYGLWLIHPLQARPTETVRRQILTTEGVIARIFTTFDLERRPFWVANNLLN